MMAELIAQEHIDHGLLRRIWRADHPVTISEVRMSVSRSRVACPTTPKSFEVRTLELLERLDREVDKLRGILATDWLTARHSKDWYLGDATAEDWQRAYQAIDQIVEAT